QKKNNDYQEYTETKMTGFNVTKGITTVGKKNWSIDIIAGNVLRDKAVPLNTNAASLVTLLTIGDEKILLTGDSTVETQDFLYKTYKNTDTIKNLSIFQIPHHGSEECISKSAFIKHINPEQLIISVGLINDSYCLPRYKVLNAWYSASRLAAVDAKEKVIVDYWKDNDEAYPDHKDFKNFQAILDLWKKKGYAYILNDSRTFTWLSDTADAGIKGSTAFFGFKNTGFYLYRAQADKDIWETGSMGNLPITIS
ncbi:MAG: hypothetical protein Q8936_25320, partial [Bacillota bacterium]|nr:hypothetical protein [Bacillota bacterium]